MKRYVHGVQRGCCQEKCFCDTHGIAIEAFEIGWTACERGMSLYTVYKSHTAAVHNNTVLHISTPRWSSAS